MIDDQTLVRRIQGGDREALETLYLRYLPTVWRFACAHLPRREASARDAVSETFLAAIRGIGGCDLSKGSISSWLIGIARHKVADCQRRDSRVPPMSANQTDDSADPAFALKQQELREAVGAVMTEMDDDQRQVLEWKYLEDLSIREIAERVGRTEKGVEALLYRARIEFRNQYSLRLVRNGEVI